MVPIQSPQDLRDRIDVVIAKFEAAGQHEAAERLRRDIQNTAFTTASEWHGEIGRAIRAIRRKIQVDPEIEQALDEIMVVVNRTWPNL